MFAELGLLIHEEVLALLFHAVITPNEAEDLHRVDDMDGDGFAYEHESLAGSVAIAAAGVGANVAASQMGGGVSTGFGGGGGGAVATQQRVTSEREKVGRNDPCWCGSGKKFKKCHGA